MLLILASASKARSDLLKRAKISHEVILSDVDESKYVGKDIHELVGLLAEEKAKSVDLRISNNFVNNINPQKRSAIIGCDSLFECNGEIFGKPKNNLEAIDRWNKMSSKSGILYTGHCLIFRNIFQDQLESTHDKQLIKGVITTKINFSSITYNEIVHYVETGESIKCAGGFAIEGIGGLLIDSIQGCHSNVIGLSLPWLYKSFSDIGLSIFDLID